MNGVKAESNLEVLERSYYNSCQSYKNNPKEEFQQIIDFIPSQSLTFVILIQFMQYSVQHKISIS